MSIHKSLVPQSRLRRHRNVLTRRERIDRLLSEGKWKEADGSVFGLPKVKNILFKVKAKAAKKAEAGAATPAAGGAAKAAAPGAAPAKGGAAPAAAKAPGGKADAKGAKK